MLKPECLNPREVLSHLNSLGYQDITPQQLKEFIHDLKKLIKYEQKQISEDCIDGAKSLNSSDCECSCSECQGSCSKLSSNESFDGSSISECSSGTFERDGKPQNNKSTSRSRFDIEQAEKIQSSFIRPWNLQGCLSSRNKKNLDPVRLYHQYKHFWNQQNFPGENARSQLRWVIRNKMLGQEPNPRVIN